MRYLLFLLLIPTVTLANGFRFRVAAENGKMTVSPCDSVPDFAVYLQKLNEALKSKNRECVHTMDLTTTSHSIECFVHNGPTEAFMHWFETKAECDSTRKRLKEET